MEGDELLILSNIFRRFGNFTAVKDVSFNVKRGEIFALLGPNGAGKTTCMKMITGTLRPTSGKASINGHDCFSKRHLCMAQTGYVPDEPSFPPYIRASELISFQGEMHGLSKADTEENSQGLIKRLGLENDLNEYAVNFSKGMKKKLAVILALIHKPDLLILDELTNGLDPYATRELHQLMIEQRDAGRAILFSTHLLDQAEKLCNRLAIIKSGQIKIDSTLEVLKEEYDDLEKVFFKHTGENTATDDLQTDLEVREEVKEDK